MKLSETPQADIEKVNQILNNADFIKPDYLIKEREKIFENQPFLISLIMGYNQDLIPTETDEITKLILIVWEYFKYTKSNQKKITPKRYEEFQNRNMHLLKYMESEPLTEQNSILKSDIENLKSKVLFSVIAHEFDTSKPLLEMNPKTRGIVYIGVKSLVECFDANAMS